MGQQIQKETTCQSFAFQNNDYQPIPENKKNVTSESKPRVVYTQKARQKTQRQDSQTSFIETTVERNKRNVVNQYDVDKQAQRKIEGEKQKVIGNQLFQQNKFKEAINAYSEAIVEKYTQMRVFTIPTGRKPLELLGRLTMYLKCSLQYKVITDCESALKYDAENARALFILGSIIVIQNQNQNTSTIDEKTISNIIKGIKHLENGNKVLLQSQDQSKIKLKVQIQSNLAKSKRILFLLARYLDEQNCQSLKQVIKQVQERSKKKISINYALLDTFMKQNILKDCTIPDYFNCIMTQEIMNEPVLTQSGHTYEKEALVQQFRTNGLKDPCTREIIDPNYVFYNQNLKMGIVELRSKYGWLGNEYSDENNYKKIQLE